MLRHARSSALAIALTLGLYLLLTSAFYPLGFLSVFDAKRMLQLGMFVALLIFAIIHAPLRKATIEQLGRVPKLISYPILTLLFIGIVSSLRLSHPAYALLDVSMLFVMLMLVFVTAASRDLAGMRFDKWAVLFLAAMGFAVVVQEFTGFVVGWVIGIEFSYDTALVHFAHPRFYNQLQTWSIPVLAAVPLLFQGKRWIKIGCMALLGLQWFLVIELAARGTTVSLLAAMVFVALWLPGLRKFWLKYQLTGLLAGIVFYSGVLFLNGMLIPQSQSGKFYTHSVGRPMAHTSGRSTLWRLSVEDAVKHPILGAGPTRYACDGDNRLPAHPHSFPFRILGEWGFIALGLLLFIAIAIGINFLKNIKRRYGNSYGDKQKDGPVDPPLRAILTISVIAGAIHACLSGLLIMPASQVAMILIAGWALSLTSQRERVHKTYPAASIVLISGLLLAAAQLVFAIREIPRFPVRTSYSVEAVQLFPRFWWVGRVCNYRYLKEKN